MDYDHYGNNGMWDGFGWIFMFIMMAAVIVGIIFVVRYLVHNNHVSHKEDALDILRKRYTNGEIEKKEFEQLKKDLRSK